MAEERIKAGEDSRRNWRVINRSLDRLDRLDGGERNGRAGIAELRRRPRDIDAGGVVTPFILTAAGSDANDYVLANEAHWVSGAWEALDAVEVALAKPLLLRVAAKPGASHVIWPAYADLDIVFAIKVKGDVTGVQYSSAEVPWLIVEEGRAWALELQICEGQKAYFFCSDPVAV